MTKRMLKISAVVLLIIALHPAHAQTARYGEALSDAQPVQATALPTVMQEKEVLPIKLSGVVLDVCQKKGCWMTIDTGNGSKIRVTFKDYSFFVPKDIAGKEVVFEGVAKTETVDVATLRHYAGDAGKSKEAIAAITQPETKITFVAHGVEIKE